MKVKWVSRLSPLNSFSRSSLLEKTNHQNLKNPSLLKEKNVSFTFNCVDLSILLSISAREANFRFGSSIHACILKNFEFFDFQNHINHRNLLVVWNSLLAMYSRCGEFLDASKVFDRMTVKDTVSWNTMISGCFRIESFEHGFRFFKRCLENFRCDQATLTTILSNFDGPEHIYLTKMIHSLVVLIGYEQEVSVGNALITAYSKCGCLISARQVFDEMPVRNVVTWTAVISGLAQHSQFCMDSLFLFLEMRRRVDANSLTYASSLLACSTGRALREGTQIHGLVLKSGVHSDLCIESALMDMYSKCNSMEDACKIFESTVGLDEISMTVILVGLAQNGLEENAIEFFVNMVQAGIEIDANMISAVLVVFGCCTSLALGKQIHSLVIKKCFGSSPYVSNGLINMYSKCGALGESIEVFNQMAQRNPVSWNSMIASFARHGHGSEALQFYEKMGFEGVKPTDITFLSLLHACSHMRSIEKGMDFLESMSKDHGISPRMEHYACVVDMFVRAGHLTEAKCFIEKLPMEPSVVVWQALLGGCSIHGNSEIGRYAANHLFLLDPTSPTAYVLLANIYSSEGKWEERARIMKKMKAMAVKKEPGISWIEVEKDVHMFVVADTAHPQSQMIYQALNHLIEVMKIEEAYAPDRQFVLYALDVG